MNGWAIALGADGRGHPLDPAPACGAPAGDAPFRWIHLDGTLAETADWLAAHGRLPPTVAYALTAVETRPRCEPIEAGALVNLRGPAAEDGPGDRLVSIRVWLEAGRAVSVALRPLAGLDELRDAMLAGAVTDPGDIVSRLAMGTTRRLDPTVAALGDLVDECETALDPDSAFETRRRIAAARADAIGYRRFVVPQREALGRLAELDVAWLQADDRLHLRGAADRFARMGEELEAVRERAALIHEQLTDIRSEQIERRGLLISVVALVFLPLTFLTGLLGMNVDGIPFAHAPWAFAAVCALCFAIAAGVAGWFVGAHWFRR